MMKLPPKLSNSRKNKKKAQMKTKLRHLREDKAQGFVEDVLEKKSYAYKLALKRSKKICDPNVYSGES